LYATNDSFGSILAFREAGPVLPLPDDPTGLVLAGTFSGNVAAADVEGAGVGAVATGLGGFSADRLHSCQCSLR